MQLVLAIVSGLLYFFGSAQIGYCFAEGFAWMPLVQAVVFGAITGQMTQAIIIGATISALYVSVVPAGNNTPADSCAAGAIAIPIALMSHMDVAAASALAVSVAIIGNLLQPIQYNVNGVYAHMCDKHAANGDYEAIVRTCWMSLGSTFLIRFPIAFVVVYFGAGMVDKMMAAMPTWLSNGLTVSGGVLPALGIPVTLTVIDKRQYIPLFLFGYFFVVVMNLSVLAASILGICAVILYIVISLEDQNDIVTAIGVGDDDDDDDD